MKIEVKLIKSFLTSNTRQMKILTGLGLRKIGESRVHKDNNCIRGMINKVPHFLEYKFVK